MRKPRWKYTWYKNYRFLWIPGFRKNELLWKDKFESPRCELPPQYKIEWLWFGFHAICEEDEYWEQWLWIHKYNNGDILKAKETWGWIDMNTKKSSWKDFSK